CSGACDRVDLPDGGDAFQPVLAAVGEVDPRACDEVIDGSGDQHQFGFAKLGSGR
ncbi:MAG: hypothetical protein QOH15_21, partial [Gaiellales bacterium]|nr:hypothetical protein [Gaiellales bacterium]